MEYSFTDEDGTWVSDGKLEYQLGVILIVMDLVFLVVSLGGYVLMGVEFWVRVGVLGSLAYLAFVAAYKMTELAALRTGEKTIWENGRRLFLILCVVSWLVACWGAVKVVLLLVF